MGKNTLKHSGGFSSLGIGVGIGWLVERVDWNAHTATTNTDEFCTSCHEMADNRSAMMLKTTHFNKSASGTTVGCSDCHVPQEFLPKMMRKDRGRTRSLGLHHRHHRHP